MSDSKVKLTLDYYENYILGRKFFEPVKVKYRCYQKDLEDFLTMLEEDDVAKSWFSVYEDAGNFFDTMVDFKHFFPQEKRVELFYAAKNGQMYPIIPSFAVYMLRKAWKESNGIPNLIIKYLPVPVLREFLREGYFGGNLSLSDIIRNVCTEDYTPLSIYHPRNKVGNFTEIYVQSEDMVAAVPNDIAVCLDDASINSIVVGSSGLEVNKVLLRTMCNRVGSINSIYDLRELL